jgi:alpha-mannosidase
LYMVGYSHLDTEWRWSYPIVIAHFIPNTMIDNLRLIAKYPHYIFNWTGANRYRMMKEYYPAEYEKVKQAVADGRWWPGGSAWEESLADEPSAEALVRQVLYGNEFFRREFGKASNEMMLPDTFGFPASLPTILAHCGLKGFSTQKLPWGSAVGIPFNVGTWTGPDGRRVLAVLDAGGYGTQVRSDPSTSREWVKRVEKNGDRDGVYIDYRYYGTGDRGGSPDERSVQMVNKAVTEDGPIKVISATSAQLFDDLTPEEVSKLPNYTGDLLLTQHSAGTPSSQSFHKWLNRKNELLADDAERASTAAALLGAVPYPMAKLTDSWHLLLGGQFHDILAGTELPSGVEFAWGDEMLARNQLQTVKNDAVGAVCRALDTRAQGAPLVYYNPLSVDREDVIEADVPAERSPNGEPTAIAPDGTSAAAQLLSWEGGVARVAVLAKVPSVGFAAYDVRLDGNPAGSGSSELKVTPDSLENHRYRVQLNSNGDVSSIFDKQANRELLAAPARLALLHEAPRDWPAWNVDFVDRTTPPYGYVDESPEIRVVEKGPVRVAIEVKRTARGSTFIQRIRLAAGEAGNRVEFDTSIDWHTPATALKASFPLVVSNPVATYNWEAGTIERGNDDPKKYEVPSHQWFDLTDRDGSYGVSVIEDCKYASDKPDDHTLRLTLMRTPGLHGTGYTDQASQDFGRHHVLYALEGHAGDWRAGDTQWEAMRVNQPLTAYIAQPHDGSLGKSFSLLSLNTRQVALRALKWSEDGKHIIVRLQELSGQPANGIRFKPNVDTLDEVDGQERTMGPASESIDMSPYSLRAFSLAPWHVGGSAKIQPPVSEPIALPFNADVITPQPADDLPGSKQPSEPAATRDANDSFDAEGNTLPGEMLPASFQAEGITFKFGHPGAPNAVACHGQEVALPAGNFNRIYLLASSSDGEQAGQFRCGDSAVTLNIQDWGGVIGLSDDRIFTGNSPEVDYDGAAHFSGLRPAFVRLDPVAWYSSHRHDANGKDAIYEYCYLFKYRIDVSKDAKSLTLPDDPHIKILAASAAHDENDAITPPTPRWPWEGIAFTNPPPSTRPASGDTAENTPQ